MPDPGETVHDRLKSLLVFLKPRLFADGIDQDRLSNLRRLSDVRIRKFAIDKPGFSALDLCRLLADPRVGDFGDVAEETGVLTKAHLAVPLPLLGEDMGYLTEACLTLQVAGLEAMKGHARSFVERHGPIGVAAAPAPAPARAAARPLPPELARPLALLKDLWTISPAARQALELLRTADPPADAVCGAIERDPELVSRVVRLANFGSGTQATSVKRLVVSLGYPALRRYLMSAALLSRFSPPYPESGFDEREFWLRAYTIAGAASAVSRATRLGHPDDHFSAGLLHGIGRLALAKAGPHPDTPPGALGAAILSRWGFPEGVVESARHHGDSPDQIEEHPIPREAVVVAALRGLLGGSPPAGSSEWAGLLRMSPDTLPALLERAAQMAQAAVP